MDESNIKESLKCAGCLNNIGDDDYVSALGQDWHKDCFRCSVCDTLLSSWYFEKNGLLFCQPDYWMRYGESCQQCTQVITGPVMAAGSHRFHPECFACGACGAPIEDSEPYALVERTRLYCGGCYSSSAGAHSIRVVSVPSSAVRAEPSPRDPATLTVSDSQCGSKVSCAARALLRAVLSLCIQLTCHRFDSSCGVVTLHIGDRILEINGAPPRASILDARPPTLLQLTIEHNPETTTKKRIMCNILPDKESHDKIEIRIKEELKTEAFTSEMENCLEREGRKERLFKRKGEEGRGRVIKRRQTPSSPLLGEKERSSSMSKLLDVSEDIEEPSGVLCDLSRARSFRVEPGPNQKVFRACDLIQGELLGSGFFGEVYKVTHRATNEVMVLKQLYRVDDDAQKNFLKEVAVLRSLSHPNVLKFVGVVYKDKRLHLVTEYVAGGTLYQLIQDTSVSLSWSERTRLARDVSAGVGYLHRRNVIHRDLNSHNCLVREDKTVIVADFGLARIVQRTASSTPQRATQHNATLRRKRYTVVGNPYWMAPEMMNGKVYDEKVDVFSFGVILCEIIGRVSADPDFLPRRPDFGLNEALFIEKFCRLAACPEPFYRVAFRACQLDPDARPPFEVIEIWLESLVMHLSNHRPPPPALLADILQYAHSPHCGPGTPDCHDTCHTCQHNEITCQHSNVIEERVPCQRNGMNKTCCQQDMCCHCQNTYSQREQCCVHAYTQTYQGQQGKCSCGSGCAHALERGCGCRVRRMPSNAGSDDLMPDTGVLKSKSNATLDYTACRSEPTRGRALGKCVSASHICAAPPRPRVTVTSLSRSHNALANPGYILRATGKSINITKVDDITEWLDSPPPLKRTSPDAHLNKLRETQHKGSDQTDLPAFLRNQSVEGLQSHYKQDMDAASLSRQVSVRDGDDTDSSDDEYIDCNWYKNVTNSKKMDIDGKNVIANIKESLMPKKSSYDVADVMMRNPEHLNERKIPEEDQRRYNIDYLRKSPIMAEGLKHIPKDEIQKEKEKINFFTKKLLSPKLSRLFKPTDLKEDEKDKSRSKFFIQRPSSPSNVSRYRIRPVEIETRLEKQNVLKSDVKLASMGKPMTPTFRRHMPNERPDFADSRYSYRASRPKFESKNEAKFVDVGRNRIKAPLPIEKRIRTAQNNTQNSAKFTQNSLNLTQSVNARPFSMKEKSPPKDDKVRRREGISRSNYVSLANLKINSKSLEDKRDNDVHSPVERVI